MGKRVCCNDCGMTLNKDEVALNKKLFSSDIIDFQCLKCMSVSMECSIEDLETKIDEFKEQGCSLFG